MKRVFILLALLLGFSLPATAQQTLPVNSSVPFVFIGLTANLPATCSVGQLSFATDAAAGKNIYGCTSANTWTQQASSGGTPAFPVTVTGGVSGGIPCFTSMTNEASSVLLALNSIMIGGGAGACPTAVTALPNGTTATTQAAGDSSGDVSTNSFVTTAVNNAIAGVNPAIAVLAASTASVTGTYTPVGAGIGDTFTVTATGAFTLDGVAINTIGQRILLKNQASAFQNGVYTATIVGTTGVSPVFTRALDYDQASDINNTGAIPVVSGTANAATSWLLTSTVVNVGTDALTYVQFSIAPTKIAQGPGASTAGDLTCFNDTGGLILKDCGIPASFIGAGGDTAASTPSGTQFVPVFGQSPISSSEASVQAIAPRAGTINGLFVKLTAAEGAAATLALTVQKCTPSSGACSGSPQTVTCTVGNSALTCSDTAHSFSFAQGDLLDVKTVQSGTGSAQLILLTVTYF